MRAKKLAILLMVGLVLCLLPALDGHMAATYGTGSTPDLPLDQWIPRTQWGADLGVPADSPPMLGQEDHTRILDDRGGITHIIIHHTGNSNDTIRTVWDWHVANPDGRRWPDIGYHFLIDSLGKVYQGRSSIQLIGSHTGLANTGTVGIALLGNFNTSLPSVAALDSVALLIRWLFKTADITNPWEEAEHNNAGMMPRIAGHRDYPGHASNDCPGDALYDQLDGLLRAPVAELLGMTVSSTSEAPTISGIEPAQPVAQPTRQWLVILGSGFVAESHVILWIGPEVYPIPADRTRYLDSSRLEVLVGLTDSGTWSAQVVNPDGRETNDFDFVVSQP